MRSRLLQLLTERSFARRQVVLASGKSSDFYIDCKQTTLHPEGLSLTAALFADEIAKHPARISAVAGPTLGADPIVAAVAVAGFARGLDWPAIIVRKEPKGHGTAQYLEGVVHLEKSRRVAMFEDVVTSGGSMLKAVERVREGGFDVVACFAVVDRLEGGREAIEAAGLPFTALFTRADFP
jgi:orotate phosphoribosyltransferase